MQYFKGHWLLPARNLTVQRKPFKPDLKVQPGKLGVEFGHNLQLQKKEDNANLLRPSDWPTQEPKWSYVSPVHSEKKVLDYALKSYQIASDLEPKYT
jgi:hypothetical protein